MSRREVLWIPTILLAMYASSLPLPTIVNLPESLRLQIYNVRPWLIPVTIAMVVGLCLAAIKSRFRFLLAPTLIRQCFALAMVFPLIFLLEQVQKGDPRLSVLALYLTWNMFLFAALPLLIQTHRELQRVFFATWLGTAAVLGWAGLHAQGAPAVETWRETPMGFLNSNYYGQVLALLLAGLLFPATWSWWNRSWIRMARHGFVVLFLFLAIQVSARSAVALMLCLIAVLLMGRRRKPLVAVALTFSVFSIAALFWAIHVGEQQLDELSSARLTEWRKVVAHLEGQENLALALLLGPETLPQELTSIYEPLHQQKEFQVFHADNAYLEMIAQAGILGLASFILPYAALLFMAQRRLRKRDTSSQTVLWGVAVISAVGVRGMLATTIPSFGNPSALLFCFGVAAIWATPDVPPRRRGGDG